MFSFLRALTLGLLAATLIGPICAIADYTMTQGSGTTFASVVIGGTKHYAAQLICDSVLGESTCQSVKAASTAAAQTDLAAVVRNPDVGTIGDAAYAGSGNATVVAAIKGVYAAATSPVPLGTTGGWTPKLLNALTNGAVGVKASGGWLGGLQCYNTNAIQTYVQVYNITSASVSVGASTPLLSMAIGPTATGGASIPVVGIEFGTAISVAATTSATNGNAPSVAIDCNVWYN